MEDNQQKIDVFNWIKEVQKLGAGEILIISVDNDGLCKGPDFELIDNIKKICNVPLIYGGGVSSKSDILEILNLEGVDAVSLSHLLHFNKDNIKNLKNYLNYNNVDIRI